MSDNGIIVMGLYHCLQEEPRGPHHERHVLVPGANFMALK